MKHAVIIICFLVSACAPGKDEPQAEPVTCKLHQLMPIQVTYPDGQVRKSSVYACSNGCGEFRSTDDESVRFNTCDYPAHVVPPNP